MFTITDDLIFTKPEDKVEVNTGSQRKDCVYQVTATTYHKGYLSDELVVLTTRKEQLAKEVQEKLDQLEPPSVDEDTITVFTTERRDIIDIEEPNGLALGIFEFLHPVPKEFN